MELTEFQIRSKRTMASLGDFKLDLSHCILGMVSEVVEFNEAVYNKDKTNVGEELTDIEFYLVNYCTFRGIIVNTLTLNYNKTNSDLINNISRLSDIVKKPIAYNKDFNTLEETKVIENLFDDLFYLYKLYDLDYEQCLQNNVNKLLVRFPLEEGFTNERANNRDLVAERIELEK